MRSLDRFPITASRVRPVNLPTSFIGFLFSHPISSSVQGRWEADTTVEHSSENAGDIRNQPGVFFVEERSVHARSAKVISSTPKPF